MRKFAFVIHPLDVGLVSIAFKEPNLIHKKHSLVKKAFEWMSSYQCSEVTGIESKEGYGLKGDLMYCALLPEQIISLNEKFVLERIISAGKIAQENGAKILGLGAYAAHIGKKGIAVARALEIPVTTGTHYTIYIALKSVLSAAKRVGIDIAKSNVAVIGATGAIGKVCAQIFAEKASKVTLVARNQIKLRRIVEELSAVSNARIIVEQNITRAMKDADISIMSTTTPVPLVDAHDIKKGALVCDISRPRNVSQKGMGLRKDVLIIDGGIVKPPGKNVDFNFYFGLPKGLAYACMAETMILALEKKYESYSIGGKVVLEKVKEIGRLGKKHGFKLAKIRSFDKIVPKEIFDNLEKIHRKTKK